MQGGTPALLRAMQGLLWTSETPGFLPPFQRNPTAKLELKPSQEHGLEYSNPLVSDPLPDSLLIPGGKVVIWSPTSHLDLRLVAIRGMGKGEGAALAESPGLGWHPSGTAQWLRDVSSDRKRETDGRRSYSGRKTQLEVPAWFVVGIWILYLE